jgi:hypothetical protein
VKEWCQDGGRHQLGLHTTKMRSIPITDLDSKQELQLTLFQLQQSELEFHDSKRSSRLSDEENPVALRREALNWRSACF